MNFRRPLLVLTALLVLLGAFLLPSRQHPITPALSIHPAPQAAPPSTSLASAPASPVSPAQPPDQTTARIQSDPLITAIQQGHPLTLTLGDGPARRFAFRPTTLTTPGFGISAGASPAARLPLTHSVYLGRELLGPAGLGAPASLAVVDGHLALGLSLDGVDYLAETDPATGTLFARQLGAVPHSHSDHDHSRCTVEHGVATLRAPPLATPAPPIPVTLAAALDTLQPEIGEALVDHPHYRLGPLYHDSLREIIVLWASAKTETGPSSGLASRASGYLAVAARTADVYERQLGLRYLLQELILIPSDSSETDIVETSLGATELDRWAAWLSTHRPKSTYRWGHAAAWNLVDGAAGGTIGRAYVDAFGNNNSALSTQERSFGWEVHTHELGHNVGASHTTGGAMNSSRIAGNESFFTQSTAGSFTGAKDIHNYMASSSNALLNQYGPAPLRDPAQIPFGIDDTVSTPAGTPVLLSPLANDQTSVLLGATNQLRLIETGSVFPLAAGSTRLVGSQIEFTPAPGFTGQAWFTYTLSGDVGNNGAGWLHSADVNVNVGGSSAAPGLSPALVLRDDLLTSDFTGPIRLNPLLNDQATGRLWAGDVEVRSSPGQSTPATYSEKAFQLVSAELLAGLGTLSLETRPGNRGTVFTNLNNGYLVYTPAPLELDQVRIRYTARDANGATATALVQIDRAATVSLSASATTFSAIGGRVLSLTATRNAVAPRDTAATISFRLTTDAILLGATPDLAVAGATSFDPATGLGTIVIPLGADSVTWYLTPTPRPSSAPTRSLTLRLTDASPLQLAANSLVTATLTGLDLPILEGFENFRTLTADTSWYTIFNGNQARWEIGSGPTPLAGTGPDGGYPSGAGSYAYVTPNGRNTPTVASLFSPTYDLSGVATATLDFAYHLQGVDLGTLRVDVHARGAWNSNVVTISGQQSSSGLDWKLRSVDLSAYRVADFRLRFRYNIVSSGIVGDAALDQIVLTTTPAGPARPPQVLSSPLTPDLPPGSPLYLAVAAEAFPAPTYQWRRDGLLLPGATAPAYQLSSLSTAAAGRYTVDITSAGTTLSALVADLRVGGLGGSPGYTGGPSDDPDRDGLPNLLEVALGSDPDDANSTALLTTSLDPQGRLRLSFLRASSTLTYTVQASGDLTTWTDLATNPGQVGQTTTVTDSPPPGATRRFLRLRLSLPSSGP